MKNRRASAFWTRALGASLLAATMLQSAAKAAEDFDYTAGVNDYKAQHYKTAVEYFEKSIKAGNHSPGVYLLSAHCFAGMEEFGRAYATYELITRSFKGTPEAKTAAELMVNCRQRMAQGSQAKSTARQAPGAATATTTTTTSSNAAARPAPAAAVPTPATPGAPGLMGRIIITPPLFNHPAVSQASIQAAQQAVAALPKALRDKLDKSDARIILSPNMIDKYPESLKDLPEEDETLNQAELPGRIYAKDMCVYERVKVRRSTQLKEARPPAFIRLQVGNMCFQVLDDMMNLSKDPVLRQAWENDREAVPDHMQAKLATFTKEDDWGPRETCSELFGSMIGGRDDNTDNLYRYFPNTKKWLSSKLGV